MSLRLQPLFHLLGETEKTLNPLQRKIFGLFFVLSFTDSDKIYEFNTLNAIFARATAGRGIALFPEACIKQYRRHDSLLILDIPTKYAEKVFSHLL